MGHDGRTLQRAGHGHWWTEDEARSILAELAESGESVAAFARTRGVSVARVRYWKKRLSAPAAVPAFVSVRWPAAAPPTSVTQTMEIVAGTITLRVREDLDVEHVARIVEALARRARGC